MKQFFREQAIIIGIYLGIILGFYIIQDFLLWELKPINVTWLDVRSFIFISVLTKLALTLSRFIVYKIKA